MKNALVQWVCIGAILLLAAAGAAAQQDGGDLSAYLPADGEAAALTLDDPPRTYRGDELFMMIDGGADIYHEYGFSQVVRAAYTDADGRSINLEIYAMQSPQAAWGIYTFKTGAGATPVDIGQEALFEDYYLNFVKGNLLVTVVGPDAEEATAKAVIALARAVDARIAPATAERPALADLLLGAPLALSRAKYVRGPLGLMGSYIFDTEDVFRVREGMIGTIGDCRVFVLAYGDENERAAAYQHALARFAAGSRFTNGARQADRYAMVDRENAHVLIRPTGRYIAIAVDSDHDRAMSIADRLIVKLNQGGSHGSP